MDDSTGSIELAYEVAKAVEFGVAKREIDRMATAFEYPSAQRAAERSRSTARWRV